MVEDDAQAEEAIGAESREQKENKRNRKFFMAFAYRALIP
jgi:hypothetical protein